jgi:hypothetical protein
VKAGTGLMYLRLGACGDHLLLEIREFLPVQYHLAKEDLYFEVGVFIDMFIET